MSAEVQPLVVIALFGWIALWWLAIRALFGRRFGVLEWMPIVFCAFGVPMMVSGLPEVRSSGSSGWLFSAWGCVALLIDVTWLVRVMIRRQAQRRTGVDVSRKK